MSIDVPLSCDKNIANISFIETKICRLCFLALVVLRFDCGQ